MGRGGGGRRGQSRGGGGHHCGGGAGIGGQRGGDVSEASPLLNETRTIRGAEWRTTATIVRQEERGWRRLRRDDDRRVTELQRCWLRLTGAPSPPIGDDLGLTEARRTRPRSCRVVIGGEECRRIAVKEGRGKRRRRLTTAMQPSAAGLVGGCCRRRLRCSRSASILFDEEGASSQRRGRG